jgi:hypothetical protein
MLDNLADQFLRKNQEDDDSDGDFSENGTIIVPLEGGSGSLRSGNYNIGGSFSARN